MSPHRFDPIIVGLATGGWWTQLSPVKKAAASLFVVLMVGIAIGSTVNQLLVERTGALVRLDRVERLAVRDSARVDSLAFLHRGDAEVARRLSALEAVVWRVDDRTQRIACLLSGNRGSACI